MKTSNFKIFVRVASCIFAAYSIFAPDDIFAGDRVGNGGDVVYCTEKVDSKEVVKSVELLDHYEARTRKRLKLDLGNKELSVDEKVELVLSRIEKLDPGRATFYRNLFSKFYDESNFEPGIVLHDINDSDEVALPSGNCEIKQIAVQRIPEFDGDPYYDISKDLWDLLDNDGKAGLILHEIIYRESIATGQMSSRKARNYHAKMTSTLSEGLTLSKYQAVLTESNLPYLMTWIQDDAVVTRYGFSFKSDYVMNQTDMCWEYGHKLGIDVKPATKQNLEDDAGSLVTWFLMNEVGKSTSNGWVPNFDPYAGHSCEYGKPCFKYSYLLLNESGLTIVESDIAPKNSLAICN